MERARCIICHKFYEMEEDDPFGGSLCPDCIDIRMREDRKYEKLLREEQELTDFDSQKIDRIEYK